MDYIKVTEGVFVKNINVTPEIVKLADLESEIADLEGRLSATEPTDQELIALGKMVHPYYMDKAATESQLSEKKALRDELKTL